MGWLLLQRGRGQRSRSGAKNFAIGSIGGVVRAGPWAGRSDRAVTGDRTAVFDVGEETEDLANEGGGLESGDRVPGHAEGEVASFGELAGHDVAGAADRVVLTDADEDWHGQARAELREEVGTLPPDAGAAEDALARHAGVAVADRLGEERVLDGASCPFPGLDDAETVNGFDEAREARFPFVVAVVVVRVVEGSGGVAEDEAGELFGPGDRELEGNHPAEAGAGERADIHFQVIEQRGHVTGEGLDAVEIEALGRGGKAMAAQVDGEGAVIGGEFTEDRGPAAEVGGEAVEEDDGRGLRSPVSS